MTHDTTVMKICELCAELDVLLSFAEASRAYNYVRPEMILNNVINITKGR